MIILRLGGVISTTKPIPFSCCSLQSRITPTNTQTNAPNSISGEQLESEFRGGGAPASASAAALRADTNNGGGGVEVPRQNYIATSKSDLLDAIVMDEDDDDVKQKFLLLSS